MILAALVACEGQRPPTPSASAPVAAPAQPVEVAAPARTTTYAAELAAVDEELAAVLRRAASSPSSWLALDKAAGLYLTRARLSGDYDDYARAEELVGRAFEVAGPGAGPSFTKIAVDFTLHRLDRVAEELQRVEGWAVKRSKDERALAAAHAELAFQRGDYPTALAGFEADLAAERTITSLSRLAQYRWKTGDFAGAEPLYREVIEQLRGEPGEQAAWLHLMLGLMDLDRGRLDDALGHYRDAEAALPGFWLIDEHIAEALALQGKTAEALALYEDIIRRTDNPEFMDAAAEIHRAAGREDEARALLARARTAYEAQLARYPEAAYGHALAHFLDFGEDPARAVELAEANHRTRPNAEAKISLARAYLKAGRTADARATIEAALATPWNTADLHATAAEIFAAAGDPTRAADERAKAVALDPTAVK